MVTEAIGVDVVTHRADWHLVVGPNPPPDGRAVPAFYLTNTALTVVPCPSIADDGTYTGCAQPTNVLPVDGVLVTLSPNVGLAEFVPPQVGAVELTDACRSILGERSIAARAAGMVVEACLRGPDLDQSEGAVRELVASMQQAP